MKVLNTMNILHKLSRVLLLMTCMTASAPAWAQLKPGIVVEGIEKNSEGDRAGLRAGDLLLSWSRGDAKGEIQSPFDLSDIEIEQAPRGTVTLEGYSGTDKRLWLLGPTSWGIEARPVLPETLLTNYRECQELAKSGKVREAFERWRLSINSTDQSYCVNSCSLELVAVFGGQCRTRTCDLLLVRQAL
jgi:hypothetical protein